MDYGGNGLGAPSKKVRSRGYWNRFGARAAAERRQTTLRLVHRRRREAQAYQLAFHQLGLGRQGRPFVA